MTSGFAHSASAQANRVLRLSFVPVERAQIAVWIENEDGSFMDTVALTNAVARRGIGNRPGALQMNSGFRWPYGRREGALPIWAHARAEAPGAELFPRVIFQNRSSEGNASRTVADASRDDYFCLSFNRATTQQNALDAVSCASIFNSDKGRYTTSADVAGGYAEPYETDSTSSMRPLSMTSLYPPRRDVVRCESTGCVDHVDVSKFQNDVERILPTIDAISMATPAGSVENQIHYTVPSDWPDGNYTTRFEINVEGDHNETYSESTYPTPTQPDGRWDFWAMTYGYPYRGQPSVVFDVPFVLNRTGGSYQTTMATGYGEVEGLDGQVHAIDETLSDQDGSGIDRLHIQADGTRLTLEVLAVDLCGSDNPPADCGASCSDTQACAEGFLCSESSECVGLCEVSREPGAIESVAAEPYPDEKNSHHWARLTFTVPESARTLGRYDIRISTQPIEDEAAFGRAMPANAAAIDTTALLVSTSGSPGDPVVVDIGQLSPATTFYVAVKAVDVCNSAGALSATSVTSVTTTAIHFSTVSPCFVATATYGDPLAKEIGALRRFRDRHLLTNAAGQVLVSAYYSIGPIAAARIQSSEALRSLSRLILTPIVRFAAWLDS